MTTIKHAIQSDALALSVFAERCFREAFSAQNSADDIHVYCRSAFSETLQKNEISSGEFINLLVEQDGVLVAYAQLSLGDAPTCITSKQSGEIRRFYVDSHLHGKGIAQLLMAECFAELQSRALEAVWLGVWKENAKAIAFYEKMGFRKAGEQTFMLGSDLQQDAVMSATLK